MFSPGTAIGALTVATVLELSGGIIGKHNARVTAAFDGNQPRLRVGKLAARRQLNTQEGAGVFQVNPAAANHLTILAQRQHCSAVDLVPEPLRLRMLRPPISFEDLDLSVGK